MLGKISLNSKADSDKCFAKIEANVLFVFVVAAALSVHKIAAVAGVYREVEVTCPTLTS